ncbi:uncharacterized protein BO80DRAFT_383146 [Aspergillus ibericus CBS 121593]|uniref:Fungal-type protein kinase domain-containing protein n=1 Tax=Aspergillus ibericus CBS 121593 TaxID=1448316 RepID=A0A395H2L6_9EURO|nr:hypothetical protein BO80DRAFT_383146 [Aspergillus ibericus CBS 121593]RAL00464.1 hypothetical protein BO80DRAFT_383146 [Aspergillus ibericus CBS 121593]
MSVIINSEIVEYDRLIPRTIEPEVEDQEVEALIPWVFHNASTSTEDCILDWPRQESDFRDFFSYFCSYAAELEEQSRGGVASVLRAREVIILPRRSWKAPQRDRSRHLIRSQSTMLKLLMSTIYLIIEDGIEQCPKVSFHKAKARQTYVIDGQRYATQIEGAITVDVKDTPVPILSFPGWYERQTWSEYLEETLSVMLGQLASNLSAKDRSAGRKDEEVFVVGFHGLYLHIAHGHFRADTISRVHAKGCSDHEVFDLKFTRGHNLSLKEDWVEAVRALARLLRFLLSGSAKVGAIEAYLQKS